jgi:hypothetical protein
MKRAWLLLFVILLCVTGLLYIWGYLPFAPPPKTARLAEIPSAGLPSSSVTALPSSSLPYCFTLTTSSLPSRADTGIR